MTYPPTLRQTTPAYFTFFAFAFGARPMRPQKRSSFPFRIQIYCSTQATVHGVVLGGGHVWSGWREHSRCAEEVGVVKVRSVGPSVGLESCSKKQKKVEKIFFARTSFDLEKEVERMRRKPPPPSPSPDRLRTPDRPTDRELGAEWEAKKWMELSWCKTVSATTAKAKKLISPTESSLTKCDFIFDIQK